MNERGATGEGPELVMQWYRSPFSWLPPRLHECPKCLTTTLVREASPRCPRCGFLEDV